MDVVMRELDSHSSKQRLYGYDSCPSQPQSQKGIGALLLEFCIGAISWVSLVHSCGKLSECRECITSVHVISWLMVASITKAAFENILFINTPYRQNTTPFFLLVMSVTS